MFLLEVMFGCSDWDPTVETVPVLHCAEQLLFINKHKHPLWKIRALQGMWIPRDIGFDMYE